MPNQPPAPSGTSAPRQSGGQRDQVQGFLDRLARAVTAGDGKTAAALWDVPALVVGDQEARGISSPAEIEQFFGGAKAQYNAQGITDTRAEIQDLRWLTPHIAVVQVRWPWLDSQGVEKGQENSTYILRHDSTGSLRLHVAVMQGASPPR